jgi:hypothetical protein
VAKSHHWGKINHGQSYGLLADDVGRRMATIRLGDYERLLLNYIREHSWAKSTRGKGKQADALPFTATMTAVTDDIGSGIIGKKDRNHLRKKLYEAIRSLVDDRILIEIDGPLPALLINTNCDEWSTFSRDLLPPGVGVKYSSRAWTGHAEEPEVEPETVLETPQIEADSVSPGEDTNNGQYPPQRIRRIPPRGYGVSPPEDTAVSRLIGTHVSRFQQNSEENTPDAGAPDALRSEPEPEPESSYPAGVDPQAPNMITPAERAELDSVAKLCETYFPMFEQIRRVVSGREGTYPIWVYRPAVEELRKRPKGQHRRDYFIGILGRMATDGPEAVAKSNGARASPGHKPSPPVTYHRAGDFDKEPRPKPQPLPKPKDPGS